MTPLPHAVEPAATALPPRASNAVSRGAERSFPRLSHGAGTAYETALARGPSDPRLARQIGRVVDHIMAHFPRDQHAALLIAGGADDAHTADVAGLVACELAGGQQRDTLLVDADGERRVLSQRFAAVGELALTDVLLNDLPPHRAVLRSLVDHLHVLPYGKTTPSRRTLERNRVHSLLEGLKKSHAYVIVSAGRSRDILVETLARYCDATYLVVQLGHTEQQDLIATVDFFTHGGARLLGSIVTGVRT